MAKKHTPAQRWIALTIVLIVCVMVYGRTLKNPYVFDDYHTVVNNPSIRNLGNLKYIAIYERYRPVLNFSYALDYALWGGESFGFHLTNLLLHLGTVVLLFVFLRRIRQWLQREIEQRNEEMNWPLWAAALFALHPLLSEAVLYPSARSEVLSGFFVLMALVCWQRWITEQRSVWGIVTALAWLAGLGVKETSAMLPFVLVAAEYTVLDDQAEGRRRRWCWMYGPGLALATLGGTWRAYFYLTAQATDALSLVGINLLTQSLVFWRYLGLLLFPAHQSVMHGVVEVDSSSWPVALLAIGGWLLLLIVAWKKRRQFPVLTLGSFWFVLFLLPAAAIPLMEAMAEHRVYLASAGIFMAVAWAISAIGRRWSRADSLARPLLRAALLIGLGVVTLTTVARANLWRNPVTLWENAVEQAPTVYGARQSLADAYRLQGNCQQAIVHYRIAIAHPAATRAAFRSLGDCLVKTKNMNEAAVVYRATLERWPDDVEGHLSLGMLHVLNGDAFSAEQQMRRVLQIDPQNSKALDMLNALQQDK